MLNMLLVLVTITTLVLVGVVGNLLALYQIRDRLDAMVKLLERDKEKE